jgi:ClpP class serine protease
MDAEIRALCQRPWAIEPGHGCTFVEMLAGAAVARMAGAKPSKSAATVPTPDVGGVRILAMKGPMLFKPPGWLAEWGIEYTDTNGLASAIRAADADPSVKSIVIDADTPGGMVSGVPELADAIAGASKRIEVRVDGMLASAGVWAASQADRITATRSSEIGSIGCYTVRVDTSQAMADKGIKVHLISSGGVKGGGADGRVTDAMLAEESRIVGQIRDQFVSALNAGRSRDLSSRATGQMWLASDAERIGLIDSISTASGSIPDHPSEDSMDLSPLAALAAKHPTKAAEILTLAAAGKTDAEIAHAMEAAAHADALAAAEKSVGEAKALADKAAADLKAEQDKTAALTAEVADLKAKLADAEKQTGKIAALKTGAAADPGPDHKSAKAITRAEYERDPKTHAAALAAGSLTITDA